MPGARRGGRETTRARAMADGPRTGDVSRAVDRCRGRSRGCNSPEARRDDDDDERQPCSCKVRASERHVDLLWTHPTDPLDPSPGIMQVRRGQPCQRFRAGSRRTHPSRVSRHTAYEPPARWSDPESPRWEALIRRPPTSWCPGPSAAPRSHTTHTGRP